MSVPPDLLRDIDEMEPLPITIQRLVVMLGEDIVSPREVAQVIEFDPVMAGTLLRAANSPIMGSRGCVGQVSDAVLRLGIDQILNIVMGSHLQKMSGPVELYDLSEDELWLHGALSSMAAKEIAATCKTTKIPPLASVAALTHDIGKLVLVRYVDIEMEHIVNTAQERGITFVEAEQDLLGFDHAEVGGAIAERWDFPEEITDAITRHHQVPVEDPTPILDTVIMANWITKTIGVGLGAEGLNFNVDEKVGLRLGIRHPEYAHLCSQVHTFMNDLREVYGTRERVA